MRGEFKEYLGAIEVNLNGISYEIGLREEAVSGLRGIWTCLVCSRSGVTPQLKPNEGDAIDLARLELSKHHDECHGHLSTCRPVNKPR